MKIIFMVTLLIVAFIIGFLLYFINPNKTQTESMRSEITNLQQSEVDKCVENLTEYYENNPSVISTETGIIFIGFKDGERYKIISIVKEDHNLILLQDYATFASFSVPKGEEIQQVCAISHNPEIKERIEFIEPDVSLIGTSDSV